MRVPVEEERVKIQAPQLSTPTAGSPVAPGVVPAAFGGQVGEGIENLGKVGSKIAESLLQMEVDKQDKRVVDLETSLMSETNNILLNPETEKVIIGDKTLERPKGLLNRELSQAEGISEELNKLYPNLEKKYLNGLSKYQYDKLKSSLDKQFIQMRSKVSAHEYNQYEAGIKNSVESNLKQRTLDASIIRNPEELREAIWGERGAVNSAKLYNQRFDEDTQKIRNEEIASDIIESAVISSLNNGDSETAQNLLDGTKDDISSGTFQKIQDKLNTGKKTVEEILKRAKTERKISNRFDTIDSIAKGEINWSNIGTIIEQTSVNDPELAEALKRVKEESEPMLSNEADEAFMGLLEQIFASENTNNISGFLVNVLKDNPSISRDRLASLVYAAKTRSEELAKGEKSSFWNNAFNFFKNFARFQSLPMVSTTSELMQRLLKNTNLKPENFKSEAKKIVNEKIQEMRPSITMLDDIPNSIMSKESDLSVLTTNKSKAKPDYRYNPKTKRLEETK